MLKFIISAELILSLISFTAMRSDKHMAVKKRWRIPEAILLCLNILGPIGGFLAMDFKWRLGRHKNRKWYFHAFLIFGFVLHIMICYNVLK